MRVAVLLVVLGLLAALSYEGPASSSLTDSASPTATAPVQVPRRERRPAAPRGGLGEGAGAIPDGTTVFDGTVPGVAKLDPDLLTALRRAATQAAGAGVRFTVDSGWRS